MVKTIIRLNMRRIVFLFILFTLSSCQERINYKWSEINESLSQLQDAREELKSAISDLEDEGYDCSELENIDSRLKKVEGILEEHFDQSENDEEKILMNEERARKWKEEWWHKHYILHFFYNLPPREVMTNR